MFSHEFHRFSVDVLRFRSHKALFCGSKVIPRTRGTGLSYAVLVNLDDPKARRSLHMSVFMNAFGVGFMWLLDAFRCFFPRYFPCFHMCSYGFPMISYVFLLSFSLDMCP